MLTNYAAAIGGGLEMQDGRRRPMGQECIHHHPHPRAEKLLVSVVPRDLPLVRFMQVSQYALQPAGC